MFPSRAYLSQSDQQDESATSSGATWWIKLFLEPVNRKHGCFSLLIFQCVILSSFDRIDAYAATLDCWEAAIVVLKVQYVRLKIKLTQIINRMWIDNIFDVMSRMPMYCGAAI